MGFINSLEVFRYPFYGIIIPPDGFRKLSRGFINPLEVFRYPSYGLIIPLGGSRKLSRGFINPLKGFRYPSYGFIIGEIIIYYKKDIRIPTVELKTPWKGI